jgi:hypothetical protein
MKRNFLLIALFSLFAAATVSAQKAASFSGHWELDTTQSKLGDRARIDAMTMDVAQTAKDIKIDTKTSRPPRPATPAAATTTANTPNPMGAGMGRGFGSGSDTNFTYSLDGKETTTELEGPTGPMPVKLAAKLDAGKLNLSSVRTFNGPNGEISLTTKETWSLSPDGKTLTVSRESTNPRGTNTMELVFVKK